MNDSEPSRDRLVAAVILRWEQAGAAGISARAIARDAAVPVSSIYHHFGGMDRLLACATDLALLRAERWCHAQQRALHDAAGDGMAFAHLLAATIDDWCERQRPLAYAWREAQSQAMRDPARRHGALAWTRLWQDFWQPLCHRFGIGELGPALALLFDGETALHIVRWRRLLDRAALSELCLAWAGWLQGRIGAPTPWRSLAIRDALAGQPAVPAWDAATEQIAAAAARTVAQRGVPGLTHRAVAEEAGQTLGVVSNRFRSSADLLRAACEALYGQIVQPLGDADAPIDLIAGRSTRATDDIALRAFFELTLASSRDAALLPFAVQHRYLRGRTSIRHLRAIVGPNLQPSSADGAVLSAMLAGQARARLCGVDDPESDRALLALLGRLDMRDPGVR